MTHTTYYWLALCSLASMCTAFQCAPRNCIWPKILQVSGVCACRWVNCLLLREVPFPLAVRLWDTYVAEGGRMKEFLTYVLAAFLLCWAPQLRAMDFQARWTPQLALPDLGVSPVLDGSGP